MYYNQLQMIILSFNNLSEFIFINDKLTLKRNYFHTLNFFLVFDDSQFLNLGLIIIIVKSKKYFFIGNQDLNHINIKTERPKSIEA